MEACISSSSTSKISFLSFATENDENCELSIEYHPLRVVIYCHLFSHWQKRRTTEEEHPDREQAQKRRTFLVESAVFGLNTAVLLIEFQIRHKTVLSSYMLFYCIRQFPLKLS
jgi:hypothetical protein